jgi:hypothetical protein
MSPWWRTVTRAGTSRCAGAGGEPDRAATLTVPGEPAGCPVTDGAGQSRRLPIMDETTISPDQSLRWFLRSLGDQDTHRGELRRDGTVLARCGALFIPRPTLMVAGPPPGTLVTGPLALKGSPPDPDQVCPACQRGGVR